MGVSNLTETSATLRTYVYQVFNILGQAVGWVPCAPSQVEFHFTAFSNVEEMLFFQNEVVSDETAVYNAMDQIEAGEEVTTEIPFGLYTIEAGSDISFQAGNLIILREGFHAKIGSEFIASIEPFFTCEQFPEGVYQAPEDLLQVYEQVEEVSPNLLEMGNSLPNGLEVFPNPSTGTFWLSNPSELPINNIHLLDNLGREIPIQTNSLGDGQRILIDIGQNPEPGLYLIISEMENKKIHKKIIVE